jgi:hypothetical protein
LLALLGAHHFLHVSRIRVKYINAVGCLPLSPSISLNERQSKTGPKLICAIGVEEADSLVTYSHPHSSEPGKKRFETMVLK